MARIVVSGTELARIDPDSGALERAVLAWCAGLRRAGHEVLVVDADPADDEPAGDGSTGRLLGRRIDAIDPDLVVLNNRPLWGEHLEHPVLHLLHNYPDAWGAGTKDDGRVAAVLARHGAAAVSPTLARALEGRYGDGVSVGVVVVGVEECFFGVEWHGDGGPVLFPNRLLAKKGVRFFLDLARSLSRQGRRCVMFRHLAPFPDPIPEQRDLLRAIAACPAIELLEPPRSRAEMAAAYADAGVVVCPAIHPEGLGLVALEAQAVGAPIITSGRGGLADATFPPNEVVAALDVDTWMDAVRRADASGPSSQPGMAVRRQHDPDVAAASIIPIAAATMNHPKPSLPSTS